MATNQQTLAFFGATGGCASVSLAMALKNGSQVSALARTPQKLWDMLEKEHKIAPAILEKKLSIIQGTVTDIPAVKEVLAPRGVPVSFVLTGVGASPKFTGKLREPYTMDQPNVCEQTSATILEALRQLRHEGIIIDGQQPTICVISTTGIDETQDVPCMVKGLYRAKMFQVPHADKEIQERNFVVAAAETGPNRTINSFIFIRPTLLMDGAPKGLNAVKSGWVKHELAQNAVAGEAPGPALGYSIRRADVGHWIFENAIKNTEFWKGKCVTLTY